MMGLNKIINIPGGKLVGFLWRSDNNPHTVEVYDGSKDISEINLNASENPFVVEGQLYDDGKKKSYSIKYVDGLYWLRVYDVKKLDAEVNEEDIQEYKYIASFDDAPGRLYFKEYWREKEDPQCLVFKSLCPTEFVFVGFKK